MNKRTKEGSRVGSLADFFKKKKKEKKKKRKKRLVHTWAYSI